MVFSIISENISIERKSRFSMITKGPVSIKVVFEKIHGTSEELSFGLDSWVWQFLRERAEFFLFEEVFVLEIYAFLIWSVRRIWAFEWISEKTRDPKADLKMFHFDKKKRETSFPTKNLKSVFRKLFSLERLVSYKTCSCLAKWYQVYQRETKLVKGLV